MTGGVDSIRIGRYAEPDFALQEDSEQRPDKQVAPRESGPYFDGTRRHGPP
jgi:hypothetical protein